MRRAALALLLLAPLSVYAADQCKYQAPRNLQLDLAGVRAESAASCTAFCATAFERAATP